MRRILFFCGIFACLAVPAESGQLTLVPQGRLFPITFADPREIRTAVGFSGDASIQAIVGSYLSLFSVSPSESSWRFQFGLEGRGLFSMRQAGGRFPLETVDGTLGAYFEAASGDWHYQLRYTHVSAHLADGSSGSAFPYSRESLSFRSGYCPNENLHLYVGLHKIVHTMPKVFPWALQIGANYFVPVNWPLSPFIGSDLRWQEESPTNPSFSLQLGFALHEASAAARSFRMYYSYYTGADVRGQFYRSLRTFHSFGLEFPL